MKIDRRSWHYRWATLLFYREPDDLCSYVRAVFLTGFIYITTIAVATAIATAALALVFAPLVYAAILRFLAVGWTPLAYLAIIAGAAGLTYAVGPSLWHGTKTSVKSTLKAAGYPILVAHREAKKHGLCPFVEYE